MHTQKPATSTPPPPALPPQTPRQCNTQTKKNANTTNLITTDTDNATLITYIREHTDSTKEDFVLPYTHTQYSTSTHIDIKTEARHLQRIEK